MQQKPENKTQLNGI